MKTTIHAPSDELEISLVRSLVTKIAYFRLSTDEMEVAIRCDKERHLTEPLGARLPCDEFISLVIDLCGKDEVMRIIKENEPKRSKPTTSDEPPPWRLPFPGAGISEGFFTNL